MRSGNLYPRLARGGEIVQSEAKGGTRADGVATYSEVGVSPDNDVSWRPCAVRAKGSRGVEISRD